MLGHLFRQCTEEIPVRRAIPAVATMLISELSRVVELLETRLEGVVLKSLKRSARLTEA